MQFAGCEVRKQVVSRQWKSFYKWSEKKLPSSLAEDIALVSLKLLWSFPFPVADTYNLASISEINVMIASSDSWKIARLFVELLGLFLFILANE